MIVTIDGPAGAGKSSVSKKLADALGFDFLDTGAMYRCVTLACLEQGVSLEDSERIAQVAHECNIAMDGHRIWLNEKEVTSDIREQRVSDSIKNIANNPLVREWLVQAQRRWGDGRDGVTEGRDQGTVVFTDSPCKIFLTASPEERAKRRVLQLEGMGKRADYTVILESILARDFNDMNRSVGRLVAAPDSIEVNTDGKTEDEVLQELIGIVQRKCELQSAREER